MTDENTIRSTGNFITSKGLQLITKLAASHGGLQFSRAAVGTGRTPDSQSPEEMLDLNGYHMDVDISDFGVQDGMAYITMQVCSNKVSEGFLLSEVGIYAQDPDEGEILYAYMDISEDPTYIYASASENKVKFAEFTLYVLIGNVSNVTATITPGSMITRAELDKAMTELESRVGHVILGPEDAELGSNDTLFMIDGMRRFEGASYSNMSFSEMPPATGVNWGRVGVNVIEGKLSVSEEPSSDATFFARTNINRSE